MAENHSRLLLFALLLILLGSAGGVAFSEKTDARIIQISRLDGSAWVNPDANVGVQNTACTDTYSRLKQLCDSFCSPTIKARYYSFKNYYDYTYAHFDMRNYPTFWQNYAANALMQSDLKNSKFYQSQIDACKLCSGLGEVKPTWVVG